MFEKFTFFAVVCIKITLECSFQLIAVTKYLFFNLISFKGFS